MSRKFGGVGEVVGDLVEAFANQLLDVGFRATGDGDI